MARLRQLNPQNYVSSSYINTEFESIIRYLNAAELGNKTLAELLAQLFDDEGNFDGPIEFRLDNTEGLQYRIGEFQDPEDGWQQLAPIGDLRGPSGQDVGLIEGPLFYNREDITAGAAATTVTYALIDLDAETIVVYINGVLEPEANYSIDPNTGVITFTNPFAGGEIVTVYSIRQTTSSNYNRLDFTAVVPTVTIAFPHEEQDRLLVYRNGLLQREGATFDFTRDSVADTLTFLAIVNPGEIITVINAESLTLLTVAGLMLEDEYTDNNGLIPYDNLAIADNEIPQSKIIGLTAGLSDTAKILVQGIEPVGAVSGDLWLDTSQSPNQLKFYDGIQFLQTNPANNLPDFLAVNANQYLRVNGTGTALEYGDIDFSSVVPQTFIGAANGVASLDSSGTLPVNQLPEVFSTYTIPWYSRWDTGLNTTANGLYYVQNVYRQSVRIDGISYKLSAGTCNIRIAVNGFASSAILNATTTQQQQVFGSAITVNGEVTPARIEIEVSSQSAAGILEIGLAAASVTI
jgi:hypothetical protein